MRLAKQVHQGRTVEKKQFSALNPVLGRAGDVVKGKVAVSDCLGKTAQGSWVPFLSRKKESQANHKEGVGK